MSEVNINYKGSKIAGMDASGTKTLLTEGKYCEDDIEVVYARPATPSPSFQTKSVTFTPATTIQTSSVTADAGYDGLSAVDISVAAISSTFVGSGITRMSSADMTRNGKSITAPSGYYSANAMYTMAECVSLLSQSVDANGLVTATHSTITAGYQASGSTVHTLQLSSLGATTYTPSTVAQTISSGVYLTGAQTIESIPSAYVIPTGTSSITSNGIYDIKSFASVDINVSGGGGGGNEDAIVERTISGLYTNSTVSTIGRYAFYSCTNLTTASFPSATSIGNYAFAYCSSLASISFPRVITIGPYAFASCSSLATASFSSATLIDNYAFANCSRLTTVSFPRVITIGASAFVSCSSLTTANFLNVTSIGTYAFAYCSSLATASFHNVKSIETYAFRGCRQLMSLYLLASSVPALGGTNVFSTTPMSNSTYTGSFGSIYVPASLVNTYKTATNWKSYSARITSYVE